MKTTLIVGNKVKVTDRKSALFNCIGIVTELPSLIRKGNAVEVEIKIELIESVNPAFKVGYEGFVNKYKVKKQPIQVLIVPSSDEEDKFENCVNLKDAMKVSRKPNVNSSLETFETVQEASAFLQGYASAIGYMGDGLSFNDAKL